MTPPTLGSYLGKVSFLNPGSLRETNDRAYSISQPGSFSKIMCSDAYADYCRSLLEVYKGTKYEAEILAHILGIGP